MNDAKVWEIITTHFNAITFGNELKPDAMVGYSVGRCPGTEEAELNGETIIVPRLDYSRAERMLNKVYDWNQEHPDDKIMVKGHVLLWHAQTPEWFFHVDYDKNKEYVDKDTMNKRLEWYIRTMLTHFTGPDSKYKDMFYGWDVVNEAIGGQPEIYRTDKENPNESLSEDRHGTRAMSSSSTHLFTPTSTRPPIWSCTTMITASVTARRSPGSRSCLPLSRSVRASPALVRESMRWECRPTMT